MDKGGHEILFEFIKGYDCATARNRIVAKAQSLGVDYLMMVDNDVVVPEDALLNLLDDARDVCLGYYAHRDDDNIYRGRTSVCKLYQPDGQPWFNYPLESEYTADEMKELREQGEYKIQIHGGGMGCALIKTDLFWELQYPWYDWVNYADSNRGMLSEDLYFCEQCKANDIPVFTDTRVGCGHIFRRTQNVIEEAD